MVRINQDWRGMQNTIGSIVQFGHSTIQGHTS